MNLMDKICLKMAKKQPPMVSASAETGRKGGKTHEAAFDVWLRRGLHQLFDDVANEPIPDELLKLIEDDRSK